MYFHVFLIFLVINWVSVLGDVFLHVSAGVLSHWHLKIVHLDILVLWARWTMILPFLTESSAGFMEVPLESNSQNV